MLRNRSASGSNRLGLGGDAADATDAAGTAFGGD
jgi:hypothetical protein